MEPPLSTKPIRSVLKWQALVTLAIAAVAGAWAGIHGALSAALGGLVNVAACVVYAFVLGLAKPVSAGATVVALFRAEASKILVIVLQLWLILAIYRDVVMAAFFAAFVITVLLFRIALVVRD
jgi:ATP synthase protein I